MPIDFTFYLWAGSLCLSLAAAVLFLWLMREPVEESRDGEPEPIGRAGSSRGEALYQPAAAEESPGAKESPATRESG